MAYPRAFTSVTLNGTLANGEEIFSAGFHIGSATGAVAPGSWRTAFEGVLEGLAGVATAMFATQALSIPTTAKLTSFKLAHIGTDGKYLEEALEIECDQPGTNPNSSAPQNALVTTLAAEKFKDPGKYNRFYLPYAPTGSSFQYKVPSTDAANYANSVAGFLEDINLILTTEPALAGQVVSVASAAGAGSMLPVVDVRIGEVIDTQRRRRNKLNENYHTSPVTPTP